MENTKKLTIGQVIHELKLDEVAIKVAGNFGSLPKELELRGYISNKSGVHYDLNDHNIIKTLDGHEFSIAWVAEKENADFYVIIKRDLYNRIKGEMPVEDETKKLDTSFDFKYQNQTQVYHAEQMADGSYEVTWKNHTIYYSQQQALSAIECGDWNVLS